MGLKLDRIAARRGNVELPGTRQYVRLGELEGCGSIRPDEPADFWDGRMDHATRFEQLLEELGAIIGLPNLGPDASGYCCISVDETSAIQLQLNPHTGELTLFSSLGRLGGEHRDAVNDHLLSANLFWQGTGGATIGVDPEDREAIMALRLFLDRLDSQAFASSIEDFVRTCDAWRIYLADLEELLGESHEGGTLPPPSITAIWG